MEHSLVGVCPLIWFKMGNSCGGGGARGGRRWPLRGRSYCLALGLLTMRRGRADPVLTRPNIVIFRGIFSTKSRSSEKDPRLGYRQGTSIRPIIIDSEAEHIMYNGGLGCVQSKPQSIAQWSWGLYVKVWHFEYRYFPHGARYLINRTCFSSYG